MKKNFTFQSSRTIWGGILLIACFFAGLTGADAQTTITTTAGSTSYWSASASAITFGVKNNNTGPVIITTIQNYMPANNTNTFTLWYHPTAVTGAPSDITTANGWIQVATGTSVSSVATGLYTVLSGLNFTIPAGATYRLALSGNSCPYYATSGSSPTSASGGGVDIYTQANPLSPTYTGYFPGPLTTTPRGFYGSITFIPGGPAVPPCVTTPLTPANNSTTACAGTTLLRWNKVNTATGYDVYLNTGTAAPTTVVSANQTDTFYNATTITGSYTWKIVPKNTVGPAAGCNFFTFSTVASVTPTISITVAPNDTICASIPGVFTATAGNAGPSPTYQWIKNGANTGASGNVYTDTALSNHDTIRVIVTTSGNGCFTSGTATSNSIVMTVLPVPSASISAAGPVAFCAGGSVRLQATGTGSAYQWTSNGADIAGATGSSYTAEYSGAYRIKITGSNGCYGLSAPLNINVFATPIPNIARSGNVLSTASTYMSYQWFRGAQAIAGATTNSYTLTRDGMYSVRIMDNAGCTGASAGLPVNWLEVGNIQAADVSVYPNPVAEVLYVNAPADVNIAIRSMEGKTILEHKGTRKIDLTPLASGIYNVCISDKEGRFIKMEKIVRILR